jgi:hypothetical protein
MLMIGAASRHVISHMLSKKLNRVPTPFCIFGINIIFHKMEIIGKVSANVTFVKGLCYSKLISNSNV